MAERSTWSLLSFGRATVLLAWTCSLVLLNDNISAEDDCNIPATYPSDSCPDICTCYEGRAYCDSMGLDEVPQNSNKLIYFLDLGINNFTRVSAGDFDSYPCLQQLLIRHNNVSDIEEDAFKTLERLQYLYLSYNNLTKVSWKFPTSLQYLDMQRNKLKELPDYSFEGLVNLKFLFLTQNEIHSLALCAFCNLVNLRELHLGVNQIENLTKGVFSTLTELRILDLSGNNFKTIDSLFFDGLLTLETLRLYGNKIENLTGSLSNLTKLETLDLSQNNLKNIEFRFFDGLTNLKTLHFRLNLIENLTGVSSNVVEEPTGAFPSLTMLETLSFPENNLTLIDSHFFYGLSNLKILGMSFVPTIVKLDESAFEPLKNLTSLVVSNSPFLVQSIINSKRLLRSLSNIEELYMSENEIVSLREDFPSFFPRLKRISFWGNLWHCDEDIKWLWNWIKKAGDIFFPKLDVRCATPASVASKPILMLDESYFQALKTEQSIQTGYPDDDSSTPIVKTKPANVDPSIDDIRTDSSQNRMATYPNLPLLKEVEECQCLEFSTTVIITAVLVIGCFVVVAVALLSFTMLRLRHKCTLIKHCNVPQNLSDCPQNEKVSVLPEHTTENEYETS